MSKQKQIETADPALPVEVSISTVHGRASRFEKFSCMKDFYDWLDPGKYEVEGSVAADDLTMIQLNERRPKADPATKTAAARAIKSGKVAVTPPVVGSIPQPEKATVSRGKVIKEAERRAAASPPGRAGKMVRHGVKVGGVEYSSAWQAFQKLGLGTSSECVKFRTELKRSKSGTATYEKNGKRYDFRLVELE